MSRKQKSITITELFNKKQKCNKNSIIHSSDLKLNVVYKLSNFVVNKTQHGKKVACTLQEDEMEEEYTYYLPNRFNSYLCDKNLILEEDLVIMVKVESFEEIHKYQVPNFVIIPNDLDEDDMDNDEVNQQLLAL